MKPQTGGYSALAFQHLALSRGGEFVKKTSSLLLSSAIFFVPTAAFAQSTGTVEQEKKEIIVAGQKRKGVDGIVAPQGVKTRGVLTQEFVAEQRPGQSVDDTINLLPGVSIQN